VVRVFQDGDFVFTHSQMSAAGKSRILMDIWRFQNDKIVEHWDNVQDAAPAASPSGHTMIDGPTAISDADQTEANKTVMKNYMADLLGGHREKFPGYFNGNNYIQHNPWVGDNLSGLVAGLGALAKEGKAVSYTKVETIIGEGNFVLVVAEGKFGEQAASFYDLYRLQNGKLAEHWDTLETIPVEAERKNSNGKFNFPRMSNVTDGPGAS
jgi:predicted SnoaL-like aldol condensation-catalyzing enzyme